MAGFGDFMQGLQQGMEFGTKIRRSRQQEKLYDSAIRNLENQDAGNALAIDEVNKEREAKGLKPIKSSSFALEDPYWKRFGDWIGGKLGGKDTSAIPDPSAKAAEDKSARAEALAGLAPPPQDAPPQDDYTPPAALDAPQSALGDAPQQGPYYADGARPDDLKKEKQRQGVDPRYTQLPPGATDISGQVVQGGLSAPQNTLNALGDFIGQGTDDPLDGGKDPLLGNYIGGAVERGFDQPRALIAGGLHWLGNLGGGTAEAAPAPAPTGPSAPLGSDARTRAVSRAPGKPAAIPTAPAAAAPAAAAPAPHEVPWDQMNHFDVPNHTTKDWEQFRLAAVSQAVLNGANYGDAESKVDQQVIEMQQRGFMNLAGQATARLTAGDLQGAAAALKAAFQYAPTGTDVNFAVSNGKLYAQFYDEQTGKPLGGPEPVTPQTVVEIAQQHASPQKWAEMALDRRKVDIAERQLNEVNIPTAKSEIAYRDDAGTAALIGAVAKDKGGALTPSESMSSNEAVRKVFTKYAGMLDDKGQPVYPELQDPRIQGQFIGAVQRMIQASGGTMSPEDAIEAILAAAARKKQG